LQAGSRHGTEPAQAGREAKLHFGASLDRFIERRNQFQALASLQPVDQSRALIGETVDHMLIIGLMAEAIYVRRIDGKLLNHILVGGKLVNKPPVPDLVDSKARYFNRPLFTQNRKRPLEVGRTRSGRRFDDPKRAVAKFQR